MHGIRRLGSHASSFYDKKSIARDTDGLTNRRGKYILASRRWG